MTLKQLKLEIKEMQQFALKYIEPSVYRKIIKRKDELLSIKGYKNMYIHSKAKKEEVELYLECFINAMYDMAGSEKVDEYYEMKLWCMGD